MSPPDVPPPDASGTSPENRPQRPNPPAARAGESGGVGGPADQPWWQKFLAEKPGTSPAAGEAGQSKPPVIQQPVRLAARPPAEPAFAASPSVAKLTAAGAPRSLLQIWVVRFVMILICVGSIGLVYWSLFLRLQPVSRLHQETFIRMSQLSDEVEQLRLRWTPEEISQTQARFRAARRLLFAGRAELQEWEKETARQSASMMIETVFEIGQPEPHPLAGLNLASVRADLHIWPAVPVGVTNAPYKQVLGFIHTVANSPKRLDLLELSVVGDSNSVAQARARLQFLGEADDSNAVVPTRPAGANP